MTLEHAFLGPHESDLVGKLVRSGSEVIADAVAARIEWLTREVLEPLANDSSGWETLFRDPNDGRLWERTFPHSEMHGGGPPRLRAISVGDAAAKYDRPWGRAAFERRRVAELAARYLSGQLAGRDFLLSAPDEPVSEEVCELIDLIEHEPKKGGFFGITAQEHDRYMARIRRLVDALLAAKPTE